MKSWLFCSWLTENEDADENGGESDDDDVGIDPLFAVDVAIDDDNGVTDDCVELNGVSYKCIEPQSVSEILILTKYGSLCFVISRKWMTIFIISNWNKCFSFTLCFFPKFEIPKEFYGCGIIDNIDIHAHADIHKQINHTAGLKQNASNGDCVFRVIFKQWQYKCIKCVDKNSQYSLTLPP